jgi:very-short-patch-repair endonuclease
MNCSICNYKILNKQDLLRHLINYHKINDLDILKNNILDVVKDCQICHKIFCGSKGLSFHIFKTHSDVMTLKEYYDNFFKEEGEGICLQCSKDTRFSGLVVGYCIYCSPRCSSKSSITRQKVKSTNQRKFGYDNFTQTEMGRQIARENVCRSLKIDKDIDPKSGSTMIGIYEEEFLNVVISKIDIPYIRQKYIIGYHVDCYFPSINVCLEFDEPGHYKDNILKDCDLVRQQRIESELKCEFYRVLYTQWVLNKEKVINETIQFLKEKRCLKN